MTLIYRQKRQLQLQRRCCVTDRSGVQRTGRRLNLKQCVDPAFNQPYAALVYRLMVSTP